MQRPPTRADDAYSMANIFYFLYYDIPYHLSNMFVTFDMGIDFSEICSRVFGILISVVSKVE